MYLISLSKVQEISLPFTWICKTAKVSISIRWCGKGVYENWYEAITSTLDDYRFGQFNPDTLELVPQDILVNDYGQLRDYEIVFDYEDYFEYLPDEDDE